MSDAGRSRPICYAARELEPRWILGAAVEDAVIALCGNREPVQRESSVLTGMPDHAAMARPRSKLRRVPSGRPAPSAVDMRSRPGHVWARGIQAIAGGDMATGALQAPMRSGEKDGTGLWRAIRSAARPGQWS